MKRDPDWPLNQQTTPRSDYEIKLLRDARRQHKHAMQKVDKIAHECQQHGIEPTKHAPYINARELEITYRNTRLRLEKLS